MKWIKASERLPEEKVICQWTSTFGKNQVALQGREFIESVLDNYDKNAEWLDETESPKVEGAEEGLTPAQTLAVNRIAELEKENERLRGLVELYQNPLEKGNLKANNNL